MAAALVGPLAAAGGFDVLFVQTSDVRGAVFPVDSFGTQCTRARYLASPCSCYGGAGRRVAAMSSLRALPNSLLIDQGAYYFGSGTFFATFNGAASAEFFGKTDYDFWTLNFRDFLNMGDGSFFASYLQSVRATNPTAAPAVLTNLNLTGTVLEGDDYIAPYRIITIANGRRVAFVSLNDPGQVSILNPYFGSRHLRMRDTLLRTLVALRRQPGGEPDVIVCEIFDLEEPTAAELAYAGGSVQLAIQQRFDELVKVSVGVDFFIMQGTWRIEVVTPALIEPNGVDDNVLFQGDRSGFMNFGRAVKLANVSFDDNGLVVSARETLINLDCTAPVDPSAEARMLELEQQMTDSLQADSGYVVSAVDGRTSFPGNCSIDLPFDTGFASSLGSACGCRISDCPAGHLIADAVAWFADADIALTNAGTIRSSLEAGAVKRSSLLQLLPFLNTPHVFERLRGRVIREALEHALSFIHVSFAGSFMQVSSSLRFEWYFDADRLGRVGAIFVRRKNSTEFELLDEDDVYKVATSNYIASGGDGYTMLAAEKSSSLGRPEFEVVASYLEAMAPNPPGLLIDRLPLRIIQTTTIVRIEMGILCGAWDGMRTAEDQRNACDHAGHAVDIINNKRDGLFDDLLPDAFIVTVEVEVGCNQSAALDGWRALREQLPALVAIVGVGCLQNIDALAPVTSTADGALVISPTSHEARAKLPQYPNLLRVSSSADYQMQALVEVMNGFNWAKIGLLHDDTLWAVSAAEALAQALNDAGGRIVNPQSKQFALSEFESGAVTAEALLKRLSEAGSRIVCMLTQPDVQRQILGTSFRLGIMHGSGYGWISGNLDPSMLHFRNGTLDHAAAAGAVGLLGVQDRRVIDTAEYGTFTSSYEQAASHVGCTSNTVEKCQLGIDSDPHPVVALEHADGVVLFAQLMDSYYRISTSEWQPLAEIAQSLPAVPAISAPLRLDASGDRRTNFDVYNFQLTEAAISESLTSIGASEVTLRQVGLFSFESGMSFPAGIRFPGNERQPPLDVAGCPLGQEQVGSQCYECAPGSYKAVIGTEKCKLCDAGSYQPKSGQSECQQCPAGSAQVSAGATSCKECDPGHHQPANGSSTCLPCEPGTFQLARGALSCTPCRSGLYQPKEASVGCEVCESRTNSTTGASACTMCAAGSYLSPSARRPSERDCIDCSQPDRYSCPSNTTVDTIFVQQGNWRLSSRSLDVVKCSSSGSKDSPCLGGLVVGQEGDGYCIAGHSGPRCERCVNASQYFDDGKCIDCPSAADRLGLIALVCIGIPLILCTLAVWLMRYHKPTYNRLANKFDRLRIWLVALAIIPKLKLVIAFLQIVSFIPKVYELVLPDRFYEWLDFILFFEINWASLVVPGSCLSGNGGFFDMLLLRALAPIGLILMIVLISLGLGVLSRFRTAKQSQHAYTHDLVNSLPTLLFVSFCLAPSTSSSIFAAWTCENFQLDSSTSPPTYLRFLRADLALKCDTSSSEYSKVVTLANILVVVWPIGVPVLFMLVLIKGHHGILRGQSTRMVNATAFLHREYHQAYYWWEVLFLVERLLIVGFAQWLSSTAQRLLFGVLVALCYLLGLIYTNPYKRHDIHAIAFGSQATVLFILLLATYVRLFYSISEFEGSGSDSTVDWTERILGFDTMDALVTTWITLVIGFLAVFVVLLAYQAASLPHVASLRLVTSRQPPELDLAKGKRYHLFLSHVWSSGQDQVANIKRKLQLLLPGCHVFLDVDDLDEISQLESHVIATQCFLLFLSRGYFFSTNCLREHDCAIRQKLPFVLVHEFDEAKGGASLEKFRADCSAQGRDPRALFDAGFEIVPWHRKAAFQQLSLKRIAQHMLHAMPNFRPLDAPPQVYIVGELSVDSLEFQHPTHVHLSPHNPGADRLCAELMQRFPDRCLLPKVDANFFEGVSRPASRVINVISSSKAPQDRVMLYLNSKTFVGDDGQKLAEDMRHAHKAGRDIFLVHENDEHLDGCSFERFFETTPADLIDDGLYKKMAIPFYPHPYREISLAILAETLGAKKQRSRAAHAAQVALECAFDRSLPLVSRDLSLSRYEIRSVSSRTSSRRAGS